MSFDDRPEPAKRLEQARKARGFKTPKDAATFNGWVYETYIQHEQGTRGIVRAVSKYAKAFRVSEGWLLAGEGQGPVSGPASPEDNALANLRSALLAFGVDSEDLGRAVSAVKVFVDDHDEPPSPDLPRDQPALSNRPRAKAPSE